MLTEWRYRIGMAIFWLAVISGAIAGIAWVLNHVEFVFS